MCNAYLHRPRSLHAAIFAYYVLTGGRFTAPFLERVAHFSDATIGLSLALQVGFDAALGPFAGSLADAFEIRYPHKGRAMVMSAGVLLGTAAFSMHLLIAKICDDDVDGDAAAVSSCSATTTTALHLALRVLYSIGNAFTYPVLNGITLAFLDEEGSTASQYGKERLYGAISWSVASVAVGCAVDRWGFECMVAFTFLGGVQYAISIVAFVRDLGDMRRRVNVDSESAQQQHDAAPASKGIDRIEETEASQNQSSHTLLQQLGIVCGTIYGAGFIISMITLKMGMSIVESLIFLFFEELDGTYTTMGLTVVVTVVFEIPIFYLAPKILDRFGPGRLQQMASLAYIIRVMGYTLVPRGAMAWVLILEPLHGVTIGFASTSSVEYMAQLAPKGYEASGQGILSGLGGIGSIVGLSLGGWIEEHASAKFMYRTYATVVAIGLAIFLFTDAWRGRYRRLDARSSDILEPDECLGDNQNNVELTSTADGPGIMLKEVGIGSTNEIL